MRFTKLFFNFLMQVFNKMEKNQCLVLLSPSASTMYTRFCCSRLLSCCATRMTLLACGEGGMLQSQWQSRQKPSTKTTWPSFRESPAVLEKEFKFSAPGWLSARASFENKEGAHRWGPVPTSFPGLSTGTQAPWMLLLPGSTPGLLHNR